MKKFFKEVFSAENLKKAMIYGSLANPNISVSELVRLSNVLREMEAESINKSINKEAKIKKAA